MRFSNASAVLIPRRLWRELARPLGLTATLPRAIDDDLGLYGSGNTLRVTVRPEREVRDGVIVTTGSYTYGHITLSPCTHCTPAFLTQVFLHELVHAWIHQHRPTLYDRSDWCDLADQFADAGYRALGGEWRVRSRCGSYRLAPRVARRRMLTFEAVAHSLSHAAHGRLQTWRAPSGTRVGLKANSSLNPSAAARPRVKPGR
jgi:hypothetical protein